MQSIRLLHWLSLFCAIAGTFATLIDTPTIDPRIVGGRPATLDATRHQVSLRLKSAENRYGFGYGHMCGGTLIEPNLVVTASHCLYPEGSSKLYKPSELLVVIGLLVVTQRTNVTFVSDVKQITSHRRYSSRTLSNDIALLNLTTPVPYNHPVVRSIPLTTREFPTGTICQISGWGSMISVSFFFSFQIFNKKTFFTHF